MQKEKKHFQPESQGGFPNHPGGAHFLPMVCHTWIPAGHREIPYPRFGGSLWGERAAQSLGQGNVSIPGLDGLNLTPLWGCLGASQGRSLMRNLVSAAGRGPAPVFSSVLSKMSFVQTLLFHFPAGFPIFVPQFSSQGLLCADESLVQPLAPELELASLNCGVDMDKKLSRFWQNC